MDDRSENKWVVFTTKKGVGSYMSRQYRYGKAMQKYLKKKEEAPKGTMVRLMKVVKDVVAEGAATG